MLSLLHEPTAFAFKYGFDKESDFKTDSPTNVVFYDLGMTSYKARADATVFLAHTQLSQSIGGVAGVGRVFFCGAWQEEQNARHDAGPRAWLGFVAGRTGLRYDRLRHACRGVQ